MSGILVVIETQNGQIRKASLELASEAVRQSKQLNAEVVALVAGKQVGDLGATVAQYGVSKVVVADDDRFETAYIQAHAEVVEKVARDKQVNHIFFSGSANGKSLCALVAAKFQTSAINDCISLEVQDGKLVCQRPMYAGKSLTKVTANGDMTVVSLRPNVFPAAEEAVEANVENLAVELSEKALQAKVTGSEVASGQQVSLTEATVIVSGGRGMKGPEHFHLVEGLAGKLGAAVGASRAVVDAGWRPHKEQVGQTGKTVSPKLYVACGISGAIQHLAGMRTSKVIVAINKDPDAPIFQVADYGIVGDVFEVLPKMTETAAQVLGS